ncbi:MAG: hypothetical protein ACRC5T_04970 [Cetobacterium sp.]
MVFKIVYSLIVTLLAYIRFQSLCEGCTKSEIASDTLQIVACSLLAAYMFGTKQILLFIVGIIIIAIIKTLIMNVEEPIKAIRSKCTWCRNMWG